MNTLFTAALGAALLSNADATTASQRPSCLSADQPARIARAVGVEYPTLASIMGATGLSRVRVDLSDQGSIVGASIVESSGYGVLDRAALRAATSMEYAPELRSCSALPGSYAVEFPN